MYEDAGYISIEGTVVGLVYQNGENGYTVLRLQTEERGIVTAVGSMPGVAVGETLELTGNWTTHSSYGEQFKAEWVERHLPTGSRAIMDYLASGAIRGVGPATAAAIVSKFGDATLDVIEEEPEKLTEVKGITMKRAVEIGAAFRRQVGIRRLMEFFAQHGLKPQYALRVYKCYGEASIDAVRENPYILTQEYFGADFFEADELALQLGFDGDCPERLEAALVFELEHNLGNGHAFIPTDKLIAATSQLISEASPEAIERAQQNLCEKGELVCCNIAGVQACYLQKLWEAESYVAERLDIMMNIRPDTGRDIPRIIRDIERVQGIEYAALQRRAVSLAAESQVMVLTGGPGTGKTTAVRGILMMLDRLGYKTALAAPTGRAAKRMAELTGRDAATIHRMLGAGYSGEGGELIFERCEEDPLDADAVILDETSMVDILLMRALLAALKPDCRLILVGDADQLPSVGPGNVFADIIRSERIPVIRLTEIFRQARDSNIIKNAHMINRGALPDLGENKGDFFFLQRISPEKAAETIVELCAERLPKRMNIPPEQIQVLSPTRRYQAGTANLNKMLQAALNPPTDGKKEKTFGEFVFRVGDRVMQIRNNYDIIWKKADGTAAGTGIFNGDVGYIRSMDLSHEVMEIEFDDKIAVYSFDMLAELEPAFAMTVHKAQGSEYRAVILAASQGSPMLMTRSVLYTAVTRARELLIIVGDSMVASTMVANDRKERRYSGLRARLAENDQ